MPECFENGSLDVEKMIKIWNSEASSGKQHLRHVTKEIFDKLMRNFKKNQNKNSSYMAISENDKVLRKIFRNTSENSAAHIESAESSPQCSR